MATAALPAAAAGASTPAWSAGLEVRKEASAADIGLPLYPGARLQRDGDEDGAGVNLGLWGGAFGLRLSVLNLASADAPATVARFYRDALTARGTVLDCSEGGSPRRDARSGLRCDEGEKAKPGARVYKLGLPKDFQTVVVEPARGGSQITLVRMQARGVD
jgi:hypothetical protein